MRIAHCGGNTPQGGKLPLLLSELSQKTPFAWSYSYRRPCCQEKLNLGLLGLMLIVVALVVKNLDFDSLEERVALASAV